jgi:sugar/nucleoside kinase (ribokinase family)
MTVDLACAAPAFLDLTFTGVGELPRPGQERFAEGLHRSPGGGAITAIGAARLGLAAALASPLGGDDDGDFLRGRLRAEGIGVSEVRAHRTPVTVVIPVDGDRAMLTFDPHSPVGAGELARLRPRAVACGLDQLGLVPPGALTYVTVGDADATAHAGRLPDGVAGARALLANRAEAATLSGEEDPGAALRVLAGRCATVIVTLGPEGAIASLDGELLRAGGEAVGEVRDTTGAGDLFAAAWVWGDLRGVDPEARLRYAVLYASLSVTATTGAEGAVTLERLLAEGARRGLPAPR